MIINILSLGESLKSYVADENITIGVNDIFKFFPVNHLIVIDKPNRFVSSRLEIIKSSTPDTFLSIYDEWNFMPMFKKIVLSDNRGDVRQLDSDKYCYSHISPFVAVCHAYKLGAKRIVMYGVDLTNHPLINTDSVFIKIKNDFKKLRVELNKRGVELMIANKYGLLMGVLPSLNN